MINFIKTCTNTTAWSNWLRNCWLRHWLMGRICSDMPSYIWRTTSCTRSVTYSYASNHESIASRSAGSDESTVRRNVRRTRSTHSRSCDSTVRRFRNLECDDCLITKKSQHSKWKEKTATPQFLIFHSQIPILLFPVSGKKHFFADYVWESRTKIILPDVYSLWHYVTVIICDITEKD